MCQDCVDEELSPQDLNSETMATVGGGVGDEKEEIYKCWILSGMGRREPKIKAVESRLIWRLPVSKQTHTVTECRHMPGEENTKHQTPSLEQLFIHEHLFF